MSIYSGNRWHRRTVFGCQYFESGRVHILFHRTFIGNGMDETQSTLMKTIRTHHPCGLDFSGWCVEIICIRLERQKVFLLCVCVVLVFMDIL